MWLWLLVPVAWLIFRLLRRKERQLALLVDARMLPNLAPGYAPGRRRRKALLWLAGVALAVLALARPQWGFHWREVKRRGLDVMVVLDTSRSMLAEDIKPNRLQQAKWGIRDLVKGLQGDRVGLVAFAGSAFLQCPLTSDYAAFLMTMEDVYVGIIPRGGTELAQALHKAADSFEARTDADRAIVLVTDGEDHAGNLEKVTSRLQEEKIRVYAIGVGTLEGELVPGDEGYFKNREGHVVKSSLQERELERLARETGGIYVRSAPGDFGLDRIIERGLSQLQKGENESRMVKIHEERFQWVLGLALFCLLLEATISDLRRTREESAS